MKRRREIETTTHRAKKSITRNTNVPRIWAIPEKAATGEIVVVGGDSGLHRSFLGTM